MKYRNTIIEKDQSENVENLFWCPGPGTATLQSKSANYTSKEQPNLMNSIRGLLYREQREVMEEPDKIEAHRMMMETPREILPPTPTKLVTQRLCAAERKGRMTILQFVNRTLDENEIIKRYLSPGTQTNNSAILFLAGTIFSSNRYIFELINEGGFFSPKSQQLVNSVASDFINQSKNLSNLILKAERSTGEGVKKTVVSCVNEFVSTSNKLSKAIQLEYEAKTAAIGYGNQLVLKNAIEKRNQISECLYDFFQRTVEVEKSIVSASTKSAMNVSEEVENTMRLLADAEKFTKFLYAGLNVDRLACSTGIDNLSNIDTRKRISQQSDQKSTTGTTDETTDMSDIMSTASSFMNYLNMSSLSAMFDEEELNSRDESFPDTHLDAIFERMNLSLPYETINTPNENEEIPNEEIPNEKVKNNSTSNRWGWVSSNKRSSKTKTPARDKRKQMMIARSQARHEKKQNRIGKKKNRTKESEEEFHKNEEGKIGILIEI